MNKILYEYLKQEWLKSNHSKYYKYFDDWIANLTATQIYYYELLWLNKAS